MSAETSVVSRIFWNCTACCKYIYNYFILILIFNKIYNKLSLYQLIINCVVAQSVLTRNSMNTMININIGIGLAIAFGVAVSAKASGSNCILFKFIFFLV